MADSLAVTASAPGKLFLLGEYAVLHGHPAVLAAVDARVRVRMCASSNCRWRLHAPGVGVTDFDLGTNGTLPAAMAPATRKALAVFDAARATAAAYAELTPLDVTIDTGGFATAEGKLGIGASAAVAAALVNAFARAAGESLSPPERLARAITAHQRAQDGEGSGADVAVACHGGVLAYTINQAPYRLAWPAGLHIRAVSTGQGADTRSMVTATRRLAAVAPSRHADCIRVLADAAVGGTAALQDGDAGAVLAAADAAFDGLEHLGRAAGVDIVTDTHRRLRRLAIDAGGAFKPTGAGGGDLGLVLADSPAHLEACCEALGAAGHPPLPLRFGAAGLRVRTAEVR